MSFFVKKDRVPRVIEIVVRHTIRPAPTNRGRVNLYEFPQIKFSKCLPLDPPSFADRNTFDAFREERVAGNKNILITARK